MNSFMGAKLWSTKKNLETVTYNELALQLYTLMHKRKIAERYSAKFRGHHYLSSVFNVDDVQGELNKTLTYVLNAWATYTINKLEKRKKMYQKKKNRRKVGEINKLLKNIQPPTQEINLNSTTKLNTFGEVTGYFVNACSNNLKKVYNKHTTEKKKSKDIVFLDKFEEDTEKNFKESLVSIDPQEEKEYKQTLKLMISFLKKEDRLENDKLKVKYPEGIPHLKVNKMARLFVALLNPDYQGNLEKLQEDFNWSDYIFKKQKEKMALKLRKEFMQEGVDVLNYVISKDHSTEDLTPKNYYKQPRKERNKPRKELEYDYKDTTCHTNVVFMQSKRGKKYKYTAKISLDRKDARGHLETLQEKKKSLTMEGGSSEDFSKAKQELSKKIEKDLKKMKDKAEKIKKEAKKLHYAS